MFWYHNGTKHSYDSVHSDPNRLDWEMKPNLYKTYPKSFLRRALDRAREEDDFLYRIAGVTAKTSYSGAEYFLRANPSAGALYPNELYFQVRGIEGMADGIYHYESDSSSVVLLQEIGDELGLESYLGFKTAMKGYLFLVSALYYRSSWKYRDRAFRYCLLDGGHLLGSIEASALLKPHAVQMIYRLERGKLNRMFGFEGREWFLSAASAAVPIRNQKVEPIEFELPYVDGSRTFLQNLQIEKAYRETDPVLRCKKEIRVAKFTYTNEKLRETIISRRSQRRFEGGAITKGQFNYIMEMISQPILSECDELLSVYAVVNRVLDMPLGLYRDGIYLKYGDFAQKAGYLCLEQYSLAAQGAVTFFLTSGAENYQPLYQKAGIIGHRLYIAANYLGIGCSGIGAYYDDEVNTFLENDEMVLYALAIGK